MNHHFNEMYNLALELDEQRTSCLEELKQILQREKIMYSEELNSLYVHLGQCRVLVYQDTILVRQLWEEVDKLLLTKTDAVC